MLMIFAFCVWPLVSYVFGCGQCHPYSLHSQVSFGATENERIYFYRANKMKIIYYCMQSHLSAWQRRWTASAVARLLIANSQSANPATFPACKSEETTVIITIVTWMCAAFEIVGKQLIIRFFFFIRGCFVFHSNYIRYIRTVLNEIFDVDRSRIRPTPSQTEGNRKLWTRVRTSDWIDG